MFKCASFFAGVGGIDYSFESTGAFTTIYAKELDSCPAKTFELNFDKKPRFTFFENVKNLVGHDNGNTFRVICEQLDFLGYKYTYQVLNAMNYGNIAQNRERIYIVAFRDEEDYENFIGHYRFH